MAQPRGSEVIHRRMAGVWVNNGTTQICVKVLVYKQESHEQRQQWTDGS